MLDTGPDGDQQEKLNIFNSYERLLWLASSILETPLYSSNLDPACNIWIVFVYKAFKMSTSEWFLHVFSVQIDFLERNNAHFAKAT